MMRLKGKKGGRRLEKQQQKRRNNIDTIASILSLVRVCQVTNAGLPHKMTYEVLFTGNNSLLTVGQITYLRLK